MLDLVSPITYAAWNPNSLIEQNLIHYVMLESYNNLSAKKGKNFDITTDVIDSAKDALAYITANPFTYTGIADNTTITPLFTYVKVSLRTATITLRLNVDSLGDHIRILQRLYSDTAYHIFEGFFTPQAQRLYDLILHNKHRKSTLLKPNLEDLYDFFKIAKVRGHMTSKKTVPYIKKLLKETTQEVHEITGYALDYTFEDSKTKDLPDVLFTF